VARYTNLEFVEDWSDEELLKTSDIGMLAPQPSPDFYSSLSDDQLDRLRELIQMLQTDGISSFGERLLLFLKGSVKTRSLEPRAYAGKTLQ